MKPTNVKDPIFLKLWNRIDKDENGYLDFNEFESFMNTYYNEYKWKITKEAIEESFHLLDKNKDNVIDKDELFKYINLLFKGTFV